MNHALMRARSTKPDADEAGAPRRATRRCIDIDNLNISSHENSTLSTYSIEGFQIRTRICSRQTSA